MVPRQQQQDPAVRPGAQASPTTGSQIQSTSTSSSSASPTSSSSASSSTSSSSSSAQPGSSGGGGGVVIGPNGPITSHSGTGGTIIGPNSVIDPRRPVSRLSMIQPKQNTANPPLFPVGANIVFEWAFDNTTLVFIPANLTVEVSLTSNPKMIWPVANVSGTTTSVVWNTATNVNPSLFMGFYTLSVYESKIGKQGVATSGHLMPYSDLQFGLYIPVGTIRPKNRSINEPLATVHIVAAVPTIATVDMQKRDRVGGNALALETLPPIYTSSPPLQTPSPSPTTTTNSLSYTLTKPSPKSKSTTTSMALTASTLFSVPGTSPLPDSKGDTALFGRPSVVAGYNLTTSILINSAFCLAFLITLCVATIQRANSRRQYRKQLQSSAMIESGKRGAGARSGDRKGDKKDPSGNDKRDDAFVPGRTGGQEPEMSMNNISSSKPLQKKGSLSGRSLVADMGPAGGMDYSDRAPARTYTSSPPTRQPSQKSRNVRFDDGRSTPSPATYTNASKFTGSSRMPVNTTMAASQEQESMRGNEFRNNSEPPRINNKINNNRGPLVDPRLDYLELDMEDAHEQAEYSRPPLTSSSSSSIQQQDAYYSGGFLDAIQGYKDYLSPAVIPSGGQPDSANTLATGQSGSLVLVGPPLSTNNSNNNNNYNYNAMPKLSYGQSEEEYPIPILRSKSTRLPPQMRVGPAMETYSS
ncbi:hypothetical protein BGZ83_003277 [Gryganskiella cystojenkinii]|nr:hypothetical protein BGZ83_003277 [Gryganskiella cystojenkinii]